MINDIPRPVRSESFTGMETPTPRPTSVRWGDNGLLVPAWAPDSAGFLGLGARATLAATSEPTQAGGLTPGGYLAASEARGADPSVGDYLSNWFNGWTGDGPGVFQFEQDDEFMKYGADKYVEFLYQKNPESYNLYDDEMKKMISNSGSAEEVRFKLAYFGNQLEARERVEYYDKNSNALVYGLAKTASAAVNYVGADLVGNIATVGTAGVTLKGVKALAGVGKAARVGGAVALGTAEGGAYGWAYESNRVQTQELLGNEDVVFDNSMVGWGMGLGAVAGLAAGVLARNVDSDPLKVALADELHGGPMASRRAAGMADIDDADGLVKAERSLMDRTNTALKAVGASRRQGGWIYSGGLKHTAFKSQDEAVAWIEKAKPTPAELDKLDAFIAEQMVRQKNNQGTVALKAMPETDFQKTGKAPVVADPPESMKGLDKIGNDMDLATSVGILQQLPGGGVIGKFLGGLGTWAVRGQDYRLATGAVANLFQSIVPVGMRNADQRVARGAALSMDGARRTAEKFFGRDLGLTSLLLSSQKQMKQAARSGKNVVSEIVAGGQNLGDWGSQMAAAFNKGFKTMGERAAKAGLIENAKDYFPILFNKAKILKGGKDDFVGRFSRYLAREFDRTGDVSLITARSMGWIEGTGTKMKITKAGEAAGLTDKFKVTSLNDEAAAAYNKVLPEMLEKQATRSWESFNGVQFESLLANPDALEDGSLVLRSFFTNSKKRQTLDKNIYLDEDMAPLMNQNVNEVYSHTVNKLGAETEFALGQIGIHGEALTFPQLAGKTRKYVSQDKDLDSEVRRQMLEMIDKAEEVYSYGMGHRAKMKSAFASQVLTGAVELGSNTVRAGSAYMWGIPVATMEVTRSLLAAGGPKALASNLGTFMKAMTNTQYRWELMSSMGEALEATNLNLRGVLEMSAHEGQYLGYLPSERFAAPWINVGRDWMESAGEGMVSRMYSGVNNVVAAAANNSTQIGLMPVMTSAGRVMVGRYTEKLLMKQLNAKNGSRLRKLADALAEAGGEVDPKQFKALARKAGLPNSNEAALYNRAGLLDPKVLKFMEAAQGGGALRGKDLDTEKLYKWAVENGMEDDYFRFSGAMTELVTERMNYSYSQPNAMTRIDINDDNPLTQAASLFMSFPASFYQQNLQMVGQDDTMRGMGLFASYLGLETLHRSLRDVLDPKGDRFLDPAASMQQWVDNPMEKIYDGLLGGVPMTGLYPLGRAGKTLLFGRDLKTNMVEGKLDRILKGASDLIPTGDHNGVQTATEFINIFDTRKAMN